MLRRWRLGLVLGLIAALAALSCYQYLRLQAALPLPLQADPRAAEYRVLQRLAAELARPLRQHGGTKDEVLRFRARQEALATLKSYVLNSPFRSELLLVTDSPAWTEAWLSGPQPQRIYDGLSGDPTWILPIHNGLRWSLQVRSLEAPSTVPDAATLDRHLLAVVLSSALCALVAGIALGRRSAHSLAAPGGAGTSPARALVQADLRALDDVVSDHMRLRSELARQSEELAAVTEAVRQRREQRRREGQAA